MQDTRDAFDGLGSVENRDKEDEFDQAGRKLMEYNMHAFKSSALPSEREGMRFIHDFSHNEQ